MSLKRCVIFPFRLVTKPLCGNAYWRYQAGAWERDNDAKHYIKMETVLKISIKSKLLITGGVIAAATAVWHLLCILGGPSWYAFARAPEIVIYSAKQGTLLAPVSTAVIASLMFTCTAYAFSGARLIKKIPLLKSALVTIAFICLTRAIITVPYLMSSHLDIWELVASTGWFFVGVCFLMGALEQFSANKENV